jgi:hypothetical protein
VLFLRGVDQHKFPAAGNLAANFSVEALNSANSAQNVQIQAHTQGKAQGFQGICDLSSSASKAYNLLVGSPTNSRREMAGNPGPDCGAWKESVEPLAL